MNTKIQDHPHPFTLICTGACGEFSTPTTAETGALSTANGSATLSSSYAATDELGDTVSCSVTATGTWDATRMSLDLTGSFSCAAATHKEAGNFSSHGDWIDMGNGYLQPLTTPTWTATWTSSGVSTSTCDGNCTGPVSFKPSRLKP